MTNEFNRCFICGKKPTKHSLFGKHIPPYVPLCREHHDDIENIKLIIKVMNREKKISIKRFRQLIDSLRMGEIITKSNLKS